MAVNPAKKKTPMPQQPAHVRRGNFDEVVLGYSPEEAMQEAARCLQCKDRPCVGGCPVAIDIPGFVKEIAAGNFGKARQVLARDTSLPAVCGRVCPQETQCEQRCVRGRGGQPVAIGFLERFAAQYPLPQEKEEKGAGKAQQENVQTLSPKETPQKAAVVGAGPAGLSCAGELAKLGYKVTVFESLHTPGGVLVYGIPEFRLPKAIVEQEVENLTAQGVEFITNAVIGKSLTLDDLFADGYGAIFLGTGAGLPSFMGIPGENLNGVFSANEFLTRVNLMKAYRPGSATPLFPMQKVAVVGGGNVAMDAARSALRLGAEEVHLVYRRSEEDMPARREEIEHAKEEGVILHPFANPNEILDTGEKRVAGLVCDTMVPGEPDQSGRRAPVVAPGQQFTLPVDTVIMAIGTSPNPLLKDATPDLATDKRGRIVADPETLATSKPGVFAGGDAVSGAATVILAMGAGKQAAASMHRYLQENTMSL